MKIVVTGKNTTEIRDACKSLIEEAGKTNNRNKIRFDFSADVCIPTPHGRRQLEGKTFYLKLFITKEMVGYSTNKNGRWGCYIERMPLDKLNSIELEDEKNIDWKKESQKLRSKIHPNAWNNLRDSLDDDGTYLKDSMYGNLSTISIISKFDDIVLNKIREAFNNKTSFSYKRYGTKRDLSVEMKICDDGIFRAWYSSEYSGCGNGTYYLLINPTIAAFSEND